MAGLEKFTPILKYTQTGTGTYTQSIHTNQSNTPLWIFDFCIRQCLNEKRFWILNNIPFLMEFMIRDSVYMETHRLQFKIQN